MVLGQSARPADLGSYRKSGLSQVHLPVQQLDVEISRLEERLEQLKKLQTSKISKQQHTDTDTVVKPTASEPVFTGKGKQRAEISPRSAPKVVDVTDEGVELQLGLEKDQVTENEGEGEGSGSSARGAEPIAKQVESSTLAGLKSEFQEDSGDAKMI